MSTHQPPAIEDIEVYAKNLTLEAITDWLGSNFYSVVFLNKGKTVHDLQVSTSDNTIAVMIVEHAVGKAWSSIWFKTSGTPWQDDTQCARSLNAHCRCPVRCNSGHWQEGADMDEWWQLDENGQERLIKWPNA